MEKAANQAWQVTQLVRGGSESCVRRASPPFPFIISLLQSFSEQNCSLQCSASSSLSTHFDLLVPSTVKGAHASFFLHIEILVVIDFFIQL
jgi:hypothetical protein